MIPEHMDHELKLALKKRVITHLQHFSSHSVLHFHESILEENKHKLCHHLKLQFGYKTILSPKKR